MEELCLENKSNKMKKKTTTKNDDVKTMKRKERNT